MLRTRRNEDIELAQTPTQARLEGYPSFAEFIAQDKDAAIYRKFAHLSARSILYMQSELHNLEGELERLDKEDARDEHNEELQKLSKTWMHYHSNGGRAQEHRTLQSKIKEKIKEYHEAIILESQVLSLNSPGPRELSGFRKWFTATGFPVLWGRDQDLFKNERDLVALAPVDTDRLNIFLKNYFGFLFDEKRDHLPADNDLYYFSEKSIQRAGAVISVLLSAILLIGAIVCLLLVRNRSIGLRIGMIVLFTCLFAGVVGLLTNARRAEIFGSTAA